MSKTRSTVMAESKKKAVVAGATTVGAVALGVLGWPIAAVGVGVPAAILTYRWWKHRAENGIKF